MEKKGPSRSVLFAVKEFIRVLAHRPDDGKIVIETTGEDKTLQYLCLNPTTTLKRILDQVKALIFISGTLEPSQEFNLLINLAGKASRFSCDHIIPRQHFQGIVVPSVAGKPLDFRYQTRSSEDQMGMIISVLHTACSKTPKEGGIIVFLQSYAYKTQFVSYLKAGEHCEKISRKIFEESKEHDVFADYSKEIAKKGSALLFCVIGGKLSEGINFSDDLARTVIVCGLPFANSQSVEIQEKMRYFDKVGDPHFRGGDYYENLCMKTLNQSIGRAIRHINDYATILLLD